MSITVHLENLTKQQIKKIIGEGAQYSNSSYDSQYTHCFVKKMEKSNDVVLERPFSVSVDDFIIQCEQIIEKNNVSEFSSDIKQFMFKKNN